MNFYVSFVAVSSAALMKFGRWKFLWQNCQSASTDNRLAEVISITTSHSLDRSVHTRVQPYVMLTSWSALWWPLRPCVVDCRHHRHGDTCRHLRLAGHGGDTVNRRTANKKKLTKYIAYHKRLHKKSRQFSIFLELSIKQCSHCARHRTTSDDVVRCRAQCEHRFIVADCTSGYTAHSLPYVHWFPVLYTIVRVC